MYHVLLCTTQKSDYTHEIYNVEMYLQVGQVIFCKNFTGMKWLMFRVVHM